MINQPDSQREPYILSGKLILPAYPDEDYQRSSRPLPAMPVQPAQLIQRKTPPLPQTPLAKLRYFWGKDPAYKVLVIAISAVVIAGLLLLSLISSTLLHNTKLFATGNSFSPAPPTAVTPIGTVDAHPTFPPPAGGTGSGTSSQPPAQSTPVLQPTVDSTATTGGQLTVSISGVPGHVQNNSVVNVSVNTSEPNVTVELVVRYTAPPYRYTSGEYATDGGGNATINWSVNVFMFGRHTQATLDAVAMDQNGQQAQAQSITVQIGGGNGGG
ncbi:MAG: hypothetical protein ACR2H5_11305 [Ktedonobacteraceae bacterium]